MGMPARKADASRRYERAGDNVFRMTPIGSRPRRRVLTDFGRLVIAAVLISIASGVVYYLLS